MGHPLVEIDDLTVRYLRDGFHRAAVENVSFTISKGESLALLGDSGSGKTTIIKTLLGLLPPTAEVSGDVRVNRESIVGCQKTRAFRSALLEEIGFVPQAAMNSLDPVLRIDRQFHLAVSAHRKVSKREARQMAECAFEGVGLSPDYVTSYPHQLSGGMRQRVLIAMSQVLEPSLLIADEPTTGLDVVVQAKVLDTMRQLHDETGQALLLVTHDWDVAAQTCQRVVRLDAGDVVLDGPMDELDIRSHRRAPHLHASSTSPEVSVLEIEHLDVAYSQGRGLAAARADAWKPVLEDVDLTLRPGEILGVAGESGCGKSTLISTVAGLVPVSNGTMEVTLGDGERLSLDEQNIKTARRHVQMVFQDPYASLNPRWTVRRTVAEPLIAQKLGGVGGPLGASVDSLVDEALMAAELDPDQYSHCFPAELSGGERQRVSVARGLVVKPSVLIADEPVSMLDDATARSIVGLFRRLATERGVSIILVTHNMHILRESCDRVAVMYLGRFVEVGEGQEVLTSPCHPYTRALIEAAPGILATDPDHLLSDEPPSIFAKPAGCSFHPRCFRATEACTTELPLLGESGVACHHPLHH
ncbi:ABC transporter ATP-binding protein [Aeromicrobium sp. CTD01-1L150]|uniref:ABC transporter ATP-binding protein n=1 Tax=Aeromicrobium sp. CTD01-1L150 TaxID=3341830 RepID=UPI0035C26859